MTSISPDPNGAVPQSARPSRPRRGVLTRQTPNGRRPRWWLLVPALVVVLAIVAGAGAVSGLGGRWVPGLLLDRYTASADWESCGLGAHYKCAEIDAPLDWNDVTSGSIHLDLLEHTATGRRLGALVVDPGGPGESGVQLVGSDVANAVDPTIAAHYDVVGFDPRGVGYSSAVSCYGGARMDQYLYGILPGAVGSSTWLAADRRAQRGFADACEAKSGRLLPHVDTTSAARDMELIRADLGSEKLNYLGYSYGTFLGTVYAGLYPEHVGRFVLDGAEDPWVESSGGAVAQAKGFEDDLRAWMAACVAGSADATSSTPCPFTGTVDQGMAEVRTMLASVGTHPLTAKDGRRLGSATLSLAIITALYGTSSWPMLTRALHQVAAGNPAAAFRLADEYNEREPNGTYDSNSAEAFTAIGCLDGGGHTTLSAMRKQAAALVKAAPTLGIYQAYGDITCNEWPVAPTSFPAKVHAPGAAPILVVGTTGDPATPYSEAKALARQLDSGHLLTRVGEGHTAYNEGNTCVDGAVDRLLLSGEVPPEGEHCY